MKTKKRKYICNGCGIERPCKVETNQEITGLSWVEIEELKCILDETNQTSYNWKEIKVSPNELK